MKWSKSFLSRFEALEDRRLLAADVRVFDAGNDLVIHGTSSADHIEVRLDADGNVAVFGIGDTTINGGNAFYSTKFSGGRIRDDLRVYLGSGDDSIRVEGIDVGDDVILVGQRGDDALGLYQTSVGDDLRIYGSSGDSSISIDESHVGDDLAIYASSGSDVIGIDQSTVEDYTFVFAGAGDDTVFVRNSTHEGIVNILLGSGDDYLGVQGTNPGDMLISGPVFITAGSGNDDIYVENTNVDKRVIAFGNSGTDSFATAGTVNVGGLSDFSFEDDVADGAAIDAAILDLVGSKARLGTITELALLDPDLAQLVNVLVAASDENTVGDNPPLNLVDALNGPGNFTVFAPNNQAFADLLEALGGNLPDDDTLVDILLYHVTTATGQPIFLADLIALLESTPPGEVLSVPMLNGDELPIPNATDLNNAGIRVIATDLRAKNGVIHKIDGVLLPPAENGDA
ncbi:MAG: fasciclin domain-containing protein [bacterium]|nr:fasciclin domain-containing protein [bacterium]